MELELVTTTGAFVGLKEEWNALLARSSTRHIFLTHEWQYTWWEHFGSGDEGLLILLVRDQGRLVGIAPLRRDRLTLKGLPILRQLTFLIGYEADYRDLLLEEGREWEVLGEMLTYLREQVQGWDLLALRGIRGSSPVKDLLPAIARQDHLFCHTEEGGGCPYLPLPPQSDLLQLPMSGATRRKYRQKLTNLDKQEGAVEVTIHQGSEVAQSDLEEFFRLHEKSWEKRGGSKALNSQRLASFHTDLVEATRSQGWPLFSLLSVKGEPCSVIYGYLYDGVFYDYLPGFDPRFERYSPGVQSLLKAIDYGIEQGWTELDLMRGEEPYKFQLTHHVRHLHSHFVAKSARRLKIARILEIAGV